MVKAFERFKEIDCLETLQQKHKSWLEDYKGLNFSIAEFEKHKLKWATCPKQYKIFETSINCIARKPNRTIIEFDGNPDEAKEFLDKTEEKLKGLEIGFIRSTHKGKSDYLWVEFTRDMKDKEIEKFLSWICPVSAEIDLNFASSKKVFQVLYAPHWRYSYERELPIEYFEGEQINFDKLEIPKTKLKISKKTKSGFPYKTGINEDKRGAILLLREAQIEKFWEQQPFFYDKSNMFYLWNNNLKKWEVSDEIDFLNSIREKLGIDTIDSKDRNELIAGFKQIGRKHTPQKIDKTWVQFKDKIYDGKTGEFLFEATPDYFTTNPIPYKIGDIEETPTIDKLFIDWVKGQNESWKRTLYEIVAYCITPDKFMQRIIALIGGGANGKGTLIKMIQRLLGEENYVASNFKQLSENRFEMSSLHKKLLCVIGEVSYDDLRNTNQLKQLAGEDKIRFEFKGKNIFTDDNTATCICLTNSLPTTPDKTSGFYRKWLIIDFPNQFPVINQDLIGKIPEVEFENLARKCLRILKELYKSCKFTNEGDFDERIKRYEERSNPVIRFVEECCEEEIGENIPLRDFSNKCNEYLKLKHLRLLSTIQIGKILRNEGYGIGNVKTGETSVSSLKNFKFKDIGNIGNIVISNQFPRKEPNTTLDISNISNISKENPLNYFTDEEIKQAGYTREQLKEMTK